MTYAPVTLKALANYWVVKGGVNSGIVGDAAHQKRASYHNGQDAIEKYGRTALDDYSIRHVRDREPHLTNAASAIDLGRLDGSLSKLYAFSRWLVAEALENPTAYRDIREVIYSPNGKTVQRYSGVDGRVHTGPGNGDDSHLWHTHISFFRDSEKRDKVPLFAGYFTAPPDTSTEEPVRNFTLLYDSDGRVIPASMTFPDPKARWLRLRDDTLHPVNTSWVKHGIKVRLTEPIIAGKPETDDWTLGWLIGDNAAFVLDRNVKATLYEAEPVPYPVKLSLTVGDKPVSVTTGPLTLP